MRMVVLALLLAGERRRNISRGNHMNDAAAPMAGPVPTIGRIVHYSLSAHDAEAINRRRRDASSNYHLHAHNRHGLVEHVGNDVHQRDVFPMMIVRVWGDKPDSLVNGQVMLDGNDLYWATSVSVGDGAGAYFWPPRA